MAEVQSSLSLHRKGKSGSLRTTVPIEIVKLLNLCNRDKLIWRYSLGEATITVEKGKR
jgi:hypothetical protein